jgi:hypothetical protein
MSRTAACNKFWFTVYILQEPGRDQSVQQEESIICGL